MFSCKTTVLLQSGFSSEQVFALTSSIVHRECHRPNNQSAKKKQQRLLFTTRKM